MPLTIYQVDTFTTKPFTGNSAGVCFTETPLDEQLMRNLAMEMNISETAFSVPEKDGSYTIRFFTPTVEVQLCGHATLATAFIFYETGVVPKDKEIIFNSLSGELKVTNENSWVKLNFPAYELSKIDLAKEFLNAAGVSPIEVYESVNGWTLAHLESEEQLVSLKPNIKMLNETGLGHMVVTAKSDQADIDYAVRCFVPKSGIDEDPVTGSAQCVLAPFWHSQLNKTEFNSLQVSKRKGFLKIKYLLDKKRVEISGQAKTIFKVEVLI